MKLQWLGGPRDGSTITIHPRREKDVVSIDVAGLNGEKDEDGMATGETRTFPVKNGKIIYTELTKVMIKQKNPFKLIAHPVKALVSGTPELVRVEGESLFNKNSFISDDSNDLDIFIQQQAKKVRDEFNQGIEKKLVELVDIFGEDILKHIKIVMEPMMFSVADTSDNQSKVVVTVHGRLEYHEEEINSGR